MLKHAHQVYLQGSLKLEFADIPQEKSMDCFLQFMYFKLDSFFFFLHLPVVSHVLKI